MYKDCSEITILLPWFANGSLDARNKMVVLTHMALCEKCRKELVELVYLNNTVKFLNEKEPGSDFKRSLFEDIKSEILNNKGMYHQPKAERTAAPSSAYNDFSPLEIPWLVLGSIRNAYKAELEKVYQTIEPVVSSLKNYAGILSATV